ncbi:selenocysteine-specific translation elongation factor [Cupriavidus sp. SZY C1]|uniref:selenocysteine-specific translation elongation factor n=1 Tax=Cupriavidus sp. SZY C1 TaxID=3055037 RepID=UPI0028B4A901|nr:selenocysteine-specific translation elongation factor [Cupriavidus sp. SZY C1]MDT6964091.1 selenocysteine-specific translation elongation factor [Cupriavidus sp. SZY C1]
MIVGTAGHIDHGKTTLVRALTGVDTDRLKEEKARGISIELGYAYTPLPGGDVLGYIDVPGHERLIHTMAAGASGIDLALLVVAADDGVMPQTREHVAIVERLGVPRAVVALTKADHADAARLAAVRDEIASLLAATPYAGADIFAVNATDAADAGVARLRDWLHDAARQQPARRSDGRFRLAVDRVFTLAGHGTVVTGTVFDGRVAVGDVMQVAPSGLPARVRSIHAQNRPADAGLAGQRCALNLAGVDKDAIRRGDWIVDPVLMAPVTRLDVRLTLQPGADLRIGHWTPVHVHLGAAHRVANVVLLDAESLDAGGTALAQLVFAAPLCALAGDRIIVRNAQATQTVGGGVVLDNLAPERHRRTPARLAWLQAVERYLSGQGLAALLEHAPHGLGERRMVQLTGRAADAGTLPPDAQRVGDTWILARDVDALRARVLDTLAGFHARMPDEPGLGAGSLRRVAFAGAPLPDALWSALLDTLLQRHDVERHGGWLRLPGHAITFTDAEQALAARLLPRVAAGGFDPPWVREHAVALNAPEEQVRQVLRKLARQGDVHQVVRDLFYAAPVIEALAGRFGAMAAAHGRVEVIAFRDAVGLGRKRTIQLLEFFDRAGYTRRVANARMLRPDSEWRPAAPPTTEGIRIR